MADQNVNIGIKTTAEGDGAKKTIKELKELEKSEDRVVATSAKLERNTRTLDRAQRRFGEGSKAVAKSGRNTGLAMLELGRAVEDAQYGFRGVANNLPQLLLLLGVGGGLTGVFTILITALAVLGPKFLDLIDPMQKVEAQAKKNADAVKDATVELNKSAKAHDNAAKSAGRQESTTRKLTNAYSRLKRELEEIRKLEEAQTSEADDKEERDIRRLEAAAAIEKKRVDAGVGRYGSKTDDQRESIKAQIDNALEERIAAVRDEASRKREQAASTSKLGLSQELQFAQGLVEMIRADKGGALKESERESLTAEMKRLQAEGRDLMARSMLERSQGKDLLADQSAEFAQDPLKRAGEIKKRLDADKEISEKYGGDIAGALAQAESKIDDLEKQIKDAEQRMSKESESREVRSFEGSVRSQIFDLEEEQRQKAVRKKQELRDQQASLESEKENAAVLGGDISAEASRAVEGAKSRGFETGAAVLDVLAKAFKDGAISSAESGAVEEAKSALLQVAGDNNSATLSALSALLAKYDESTQRIRTLEAQIKNRR